MKTSARFSTAIVVSAGVVVVAACGSTDNGSGGPWQSSSSGGGTTSSSGSGSTSGSSSGSSGRPMSSSGSGSTSSSGTTSGSSGGSSSSGSSGGAAGGDGGSMDGTMSGGGDASLPSGIPGAGGSCNPVPTITGTLVSQLLAATTAAKCTNIVPNSSLNGGAGHTDNNGGGMINICQANGAIFWTSGMAVDCDGLADSCTNGVMLGANNAQHCPGDDPTNQGQTSFNDANGMPLKAGMVPYIVISQDVTNVMGLDNTSTGGNAVAVIYNNKLIFAVFGDQGPVGAIGESAFMTAASLGINPDPNTGGTAGPVTFIIFTSPGAVPQDLGNPMEAWQIGLPLAQQFIANNP
jgi:hypothetical protein